VTTSALAPRDPVDVDAPIPAATERKPANRQRWLSWWRVVPALAILLIAVIGPWLTPYSATDVIATPSIWPNGTYLMGTDASGLDVFSRVVAGTRNDVVIALADAVLATSVGIAVGLAVGMNESKRGPLGLLARGFSRGLDLLQAIPAIVIGLVLVAFFGSSVTSLTVALAVILAPNQARLVRTEVLRTRTEAYLDAARMAGEREFVLTMRHVLPNASWAALENTSVVFGSAILNTAALGFLGVGLHPPTPEWGSMISTGASDAAVGRWWPALFPAAAMVACVFAFAAAGQRLFGRK
jgi:peptide/nickel transport system permease protein